VQRVPKCIDRSSSSAPTTARRRVHQPLASGTILESLNERPIRTGRFVAKVPRTCGGRARAIPRQTPHRNAWPIGTEEIGLPFPTLQTDRRRSRQSISRPTPESANKSIGLNGSIPEVGLEPTRSCDHWILSPARLPFRHSGPSVGIRIPGKYGSETRDCPAPTLVFDWAFEPKRCGKNVIRLSILVTLRTIPKVSQPDRR